jgi:hypothetical protein
MLGSNVHVSAPYRATGRTREWYIFALIEVERWDVDHNRLRRAKTAPALSSLSWMVEVRSRCVLTSLPR